MSGQSDIEHAIEAVALNDGSLMATLGWQNKYPDMIRASRLVMGDNTRESQDMATLTSASGGTDLDPEYVVVAANAVGQAYSTLHDALENPDNYDSGGALGSKYIYKTSILLDRLESFVLEMAQEVANTSKTHQETFYNAPHHGEINKARKGALEEVINILYKT